MLSKELLEILACPKCKSEKQDLVYDQKNEKLICNICRLKYKITEDIPVMLIEEAESF